MATATIADRLAELTQAKDDRRDETYAAYRALVVADVDGKEVDPAEAAEILLAAGKDCQDLVADVDVLLKRRTWAKELEAETGLPERSRDIEDRLGKLRAERDRVVRELDQKISAVALERAQLTDRVTALAHVRKQLVASAPAELLARQRGIEAALGEAGGARQQLAMELHRVRGQREVFQRKVDHVNTSTSAEHVSDEQRGYYRQSVVEQDKRITLLEQQLDAMQRDADEMLVELADIEREKLLP